MSLRGEKDVKTYVYIDLVFIVNFVANYLILLAAGKLGGYRIKKARVALAAGIGALYGVSAFFVPFKSLYGLPLRIVLGLLMVLLSYPGVTGVRLVGLCLSFFLCSAIAAGVALALYTTRSASLLGYALFPRGLAATNWWATGLAMLFISGLPFVLKFAGKAPGNLPLITVELVLGEKKVSLVGLVDTGNELRDPLSGLPVVVVEFDSIADLIPVEMTKLLDAGWDPLLRQIEGTLLERRIRLIPYKNLEGEKGILPGFKPDCLVLNEKNGLKCEREVVVGVSFAPLSPSGLYHALLHPDVVKP